jgi:hypothetical protein
MKLLCAMFILVAAITSARSEYLDGNTLLATILLPNCSVRSRTRQHQGVSWCSIIADLLDALLRIGTRGYRSRRIKETLY